jgi:hypothetical protein
MKDVADTADDAAENADAGAGSGLGFCVADDADVLGQMPQRQQLMQQDRQVSGVRQRAVNLWNGLFGERHDVRMYKDMVVKQHKVRLVWCNYLILLGSRLAPAAASAGLWVTSAAIAKFVRQDLLPTRGDSNAFATAGASRQSLLHAAGVWGLWGQQLYAHVQGYGREAAQGETETALVFACVGAVAAALLPSVITPCAVSGPRSTALLFVSGPAVPHCFLCLGPAVPHCFLCLGPAVPHCFFHPSCGILLLECAFYSAFPLSPTLKFIRNICLACFCNSAQNFACCYFTSFAARRGLDHDMEVQVLAVKLRRCFWL